MKTLITRRQFLRHSAATAGALALAGPMARPSRADDTHQAEWLAATSDPFRDELLRARRDLPNRVRACAEPLRGEPAFDPAWIERLAAKIRLPASARFEHPLLERAVRVGLAHIEATFQGDHPTNFRYWPELLSSGVLPRQWMRRVVNARLTGGGQFCGMTRFGDCLDDWPLMNHLEGLWALGRRDDYRLCLWGHICHHQAEGHLTAYEAVAFPPGQKVSDYCLPCQLVAVRAARRLV